MTPRWAILLAILGTLMGPAVVHGQTVRSDRPTTRTVQIITTNGWQLEVWVAGKRVGLTPTETVVPVGRVPFTAGTFGVEPLVDMMEVGEESGQAVVLVARPMQTDRLDESFQRLVLARRIDPNNPHIVLLSALLCADERDLDGLVELLPEELHSHPNVLITRARFALRDGRLEEALEFSDRAIRADRDLATTYRLKARVLMRLGRLTEAVAAADIAVALEPRNARSFTTRGEAYQRQAKTYAASLDYERALELEPEYAPARLALESLTNPEP